MGFALDGPNKKKVSLYVKYKKCRWVAPEREFNKDNSSGIRIFESAVKIKPNKMEKLQ